MNDTNTADMELDTIATKQDISEMAAHAIQYAQEHPADNIEFLIFTLKSNLVFSIGILQQNVVSHQQSMNELSIAILARCAARVLDIPAQGDSAFADEINKAIEVMNKNAEEIAATQLRSIEQMNRVVFDAKEAIEKISA